MMSSFFLASMLGINTQELNNFRTSLPTGAYTRTTTSAGPSSPPPVALNEEVMRGISELPAQGLPAQDSNDSKTTPLPGLVENVNAIPPPPPYSEHASTTPPFSPQASFSQNTYAASSPHPQPPFTPPVYDTAAPSFLPNPSHRETYSIPKSDAISASKSINLTGPLHILGKVSSSSSVTLTNSITIDGKVNSSSSITLTNGIFVADKVNSSSRIKIDGAELGASFGGKLDASGSIEILGGSGPGVDVGEKVSASGSVLIMGGKGGVRVKGKVSASGGVEIRGDVTVGEEINASGKVKIYCGDAEGGRLKFGGKINGSRVHVEGHFLVEGDLYVNSNLTVLGSLTVTGDLTVKGNLTVLPGAPFEVGGKRTIHGSIKFSK